MTRIHLLALSIASIAFAACTGELVTTGPGGTGEDGTSGDRGNDDGGDDGDAPDGGAGDPGPEPEAFACRDEVVTGIRSGEHNPGQDCMGSCHDHGFTLAGTVSLTAAGGQPVVGATITVVDSANKTVDMVTARNGNFYTTTSVTFPVKVAASSCPDVKPMVGLVTAGGAGCNMAGCHVGGVGTGAIHLP